MTLRGGVGRSPAPPSRIRSAASYGEAALARPVRVTRPVIFHLVRDPSAEHRGEEKNRQRDRASHVQGEGVPALALPRRCPLTNRPGETEPGIRVAGVPGVPHCSSHLIPGRRGHLSTAVRAHKLRHHAPGPVGARPCLEVGTFDESDGLVISGNPAPAEGTRPAVGARGFEESGPGPLRSAETRSCRAWCLRTGSGRVSPPRANAAGWVRPGCHWAAVCWRIGRARKRPGRRQARRSPRGRRRPGKLRGGPACAGRTLASL